MAEVAGAAWAAEEVVSTTAQVGVGAYMVAKPTMPLKATFTQIATSSDDETRLSLSRSNHTLSIVGNKAYIFGGDTAAGKLAGNEVHVVTLESSDKPEPDYSVIPAVAVKEDGEVPAARTKHAACSVDQSLVIFGGVDETGQTIDEGPIFWLFDTSKSTWKTLEASHYSAAPRPRHGARVFQHRKNLLVYGGLDASGSSLNDVWHFDCTSRLWERLPNAPVSSSDVAVADDRMYIVSPNDAVSSDVHYLLLSLKEGDPQDWTTIPFPTNPMAPGPQPRKDAGLLPISTGYGRNYLAYLFGQRPDNIPPPVASMELEAGDPPTMTAAEEELAQSDQSSSTHITQQPSDSAPLASAPLYHSDTWTYQLPSSTPELKATTQFYEAIKPAAIKDFIRGTLGYDDGKHSWSETEVLAPTDLAVSEGKLHPGPRAAFACDAMDNQHSVVLWGGMNAKGEREGDGWIVKFE